MVLKAVLFSLGGTDVFGETYEWGTGDNALGFDLGELLPKGAQFSDSITSSLRVWMQIFMLLSFFLIRLFYVSLNLVSAICYRFCLGCLAKVAGGIVSTLNWGIVGSQQPGPGVSDFIRLGIRGIPLLKRLGEFLSTFEMMSFSMFFLVSQNSGEECVGLMSKTRSLLSLEIQKFLRCPLSFLISIKSRESCTSSLWGSNLCDLLINIFFSSCLFERKFFFSLISVRQYPGPGVVSSSQTVIPELLELVESALVLDWAGFFTSLYLLCFGDWSYFFSHSLIFWLWRLRAYQSLTRANIPVYSSFRLCISFFGGEYLTIPFGSCFIKVLYSPGPGESSFTPSNLGLDTFSGNLRYDSLSLVITQPNFSILPGIEGDFSIFLIFFFASKRVIGFPFYLLNMQALALSLSLRSVLSQLSSRSNLGRWLISRSHLDLKKYCWLSLCFFFMIYRGLLSISGRLVKFLNAFSLQMRFPYSRWKCLQANPFDGDAFGAQFNISDSEAVQSHCDACRGASDGSMGSSRALGLRKTNAIGFFCVQQEYGSQWKQMITLSSAFHGEDPRGPGSSTSNPHYRKPHTVGFQSDSTEPIPSSSSRSVLLPHFG